jgi:hypothetical protein
MVAVLSLCIWTGGNDCHGHAIDQPPRNPAEQQPVIAERPIADYVSMWELTRAMSRARRQSPFVY